MTFPRFIRSLNVFATIRNLTEQVRLLQVSNLALYDRARTARQTAQAAEAKATRIGHNWQEMYNLLVEDLGNHEDAIAFFMDERETFKANIALRDELGIELVGALVEAEQEIGLRDQALSLATSDVIAVQAQLTTATAEVQEQAGEIVETIGYVKLCEDALRLVGVTIVDTDMGPEVAIDQPTLLSAVRLGLIVAPEAVAA